LNNSQYFRSWLYDELPDSVISRISRRISEATDLNTTYPTAEPLQVGQSRDCMRDLLVYPIAPPVALVGK